MHKEGGVTPESVAESSPETLGDRQSVQFFITLKDRMIDQAGIPNQKELNVALYKLSDQLGNLQTVETVLDQRPNGGLVEPVKDKFRDPVPEGYLEIDKYLSFGRRHQNVVEAIKTKDLIKWKQVILDYLKNLEKYENPLNLLKAVEFSPQISVLLEKYKKTRVYDLLEPGLEIGEGELSGLVYDIRATFEYRNRKIKEFVAYRYALSVPVDVNEEDFIKNTHTILDSSPEDVSNNGYRTKEVKISAKSIRPFHPNTLPYAMTKLREDIEGVQSLDSKLEVEKAALKDYIIFEIIHPFEDADGRTGRALFVHLQRRYSPQKSFGSLPVHMPIARYESGTIFPQEVKDGEYKAMHLGSLSLDVNTLLTRIIYREDILEAGKDLPGWAEFERKQWTKSEFQEVVNNVIDKIREILNSAEVDVKIDELIGVINKQSSLDDMQSQDWVMVYESAKEQLKAKTN